MTDPRFPRVHVTEIVKEGGRLYQQPVSSPICDFCGDAYPKWDYDCEDFDISHLIPRGSSVGAWATCDECSVLIEADDRDGLAERAMVISTHDRDTVGWNRQRWGVGLFHEQFFQRRKGERKAWG